MVLTRQINSNIVQPDGRRVIQPNGIRERSSVFAREVSSCVLIEKLRKEIKNQE